MSASFTCHHQVLLPGGNHHNHINHTHQGLPLRLHKTTLASSITTPKTSTSPTAYSLNSGYDQSSYLAVSTVPSLDITARAISPCLTDISDTKTFYSTVEVTEIPSDACDTPTALDLPSDEADQMETSPGRVEAPTTVPSTPSSTRHCTPKRKRTISPPSSSSKSPNHPRSTSRSTRRSVPASRRSSPNSHRRAATSTSLTPSVVDRKDPETKRETLLALHRESCRLFQDNELHQSSLQDRRLPPAIPYTAAPTRRASSEFSSPPASPIAYTRLSIPERTCEPGTGNIQGIHPTCMQTGAGAQKQLAATVIDWTSPSTRRREYEKIDRASSGVRGFWRRVAPRWCQFGDNHMPFFEEGKDGKGNYEGSVRRFRMDLPEEPAEETGKTSSRRGLNLKRKLTVHKLGVRRKTD